MFISSSQKPEVYEDGQKYRLTTLLNKLLITNRQILSPQETLLEPNSTVLLLCFEIYPITVHK